MFVCVLVYCICTQMYVEFRGSLDMLGIFHDSFPHYLWRQDLSPIWALGDRAILTAQQDMVFACLYLRSTRVTDACACARAWHFMWVLGTWTPVLMLHRRYLITGPCTWAPAVFSDACFVDGTRKKNVTFLADCLPWAGCFANSDLFSLPSKLVQLLRIHMFEASFYTLKWFECKIFFSRWSTL